MMLLYKAKHRASHHQLFPIGTFSTLLAKCSQLWKIIEDDHLSYRYASFQAEDGLRVVLTHPHSSDITVTLWQQDRRNISHQSLFTIKEKVAEQLRSCHIPQNEKFELICPHWSPVERTCSLVPVKEIQGSLHLIKPECSCHGKHLATMANHQGNDRFLS